MLAMPMTAAWAEVVTPQNQAAAEPSQTKRETVEQRITALHTAMKISPEQETKWTGVAEAMRENAARMDKLVATTRTNMSVVDDLKIYEKFAQPPR